MFEEIKDEVQGLTEEIGEYTITNLNDTKYLGEVPYDGTKGYLVPVEYRNLELQQKVNQGSWLPDYFKIRNLGEASIRIIMYLRTVAVGEEEFQSVKFHYMENNTGKPIPLEDFEDFKGDACLSGTEDDYIEIAEAEQFKHVGVLKNLIVQLLTGPFDEGHYIVEIENDKIGAAYGQPYDDDRMRQVLSHMAVAGLGKVSFSRDKDECHVEIVNAEGEVIFKNEGSANMLVLQKTVEDLSERQFTGQPTIGSVAYLIKYVLLRTNIMDSFNFRVSFDYNYKE